MKKMVMAAPIALFLSACAVSTQQEVQMGQQYAAQVEQQLPIIHDPEIDRYINVLGDSIAHLADDRNLQWHFAVVDSKEVNAFAIPGGYVYVNRGLIERADHMDELAGVLGHEIGHVIKRHSIKQMQSAQKANIGVTLACILTQVCNNQAANAAINVGGQALFSKFSRDDEKQADEVGVHNVVRAGISPQGMIDMFNVLLDERKSQPDAVSAWFATHPLEEDRIADVQRVINQWDPVALQDLTVDSQNFHNFKNRLAALPPSPPPRRTGQ